MLGYVHSIETFGTVDGPGIRYVVFVQGCPMRCKYCHNPDTWTPNTGKQRSTEELLEDYDKYKPFLGNGGGLTVTGGEPFMQIDFLTELFEGAKKKGIHTCLDTSGIIFNENNPELMKKFDRLVAVTDLVMLDIKHIDPIKHKELTSQPNDQILAFARYLADKGVMIWIRHVVVPGITDDPKYWVQLGEFMATLKTVNALDVLPYHDLGKMKYDKLGMDYILKDIPPLDPAVAKEAREVIIKAFREKRGK